MDKLVIIDGNAIIHRAYHAIPPLTDKNGRMINAAYGFTSMLLKVWRDLKPTHIVVTFDMAGPTFRHEKFKEYKATRVKADQELYDQIPLVHDVVRAFNIPIYEKKGYEADDVIGTIVSLVCHPEGVKRPKDLLIQRHTLSERSFTALRSVQDDNLVIYIVTGDMDTLQLVQPGVKVYTLRKGMSDVVIYDEEEVKKRYGFGPEMVVDYKALRGDASDNIPGVLGIGEKTATELIKEIGGVDEIYKQIRNPKSEIRNKLKQSVIKKLEDGEKSAEMSKELATLDCSVPELNFKLTDCLAHDFDKDKVIKIFQELEFVSLLKRVPGLEAPNANSQMLKAEGKRGKKSLTEFKFSEIKKSDELDEIIKLIAEKKVFASKAILNSKDVFSSELLGIVLVVGYEGFYVRKNLLEKILTVFDDSELEMVGHDLKQTIKILNIKNSVLVKNKIFDTQIASYLLNPGSRAHDPTSIVLKFLGTELPTGSGQESLFGVDARAVANELYLLLQTVEKLKNELDKANNLGLFRLIEMPLAHVLAEMELNGVAVDLNMLNKLSKEVAEEIKKTSKNIYNMSGEEFNIASPLQLREVLFDKMQIPVMGIKKGKTGLSTSAEQLEKLRGLHPIIDEIETYRELAKLQNTYIDVLPTLVNKKTNRIHTTFNQAVTATGRLSSSDPNLQNIPIRTELGREIRKSFVAEKGNSLVVADYSQIELRIVASLAKDKKMMEIFNQDKDIHQATAAFINGISLENVTKEMRSAAKAVNFGVLYGMGSYGLSGRTGMQVWEAKDFIKKYFEQFSEVRKYLDQTLEFTKKEGYCETLFGRRRYLPELNSPNFQIRSAAERMAINHPVQGTAADIMKMAMIEVYKSIHNVILSEAKDLFVQTRRRQKDSSASPQNDNVGEVKLILQVHDELVLEVKKGLEKEASEMIKKTMEEVVKLNVPVKVEVNWGERWGEIK